MRRTTGDPRTRPHRSRILGNSAFKIQPSRFSMRTIPVCGIGTLKRLLGCGRMPREDHVFAAATRQHRSLGGLNGTVMHGFRDSLAVYQTWRHRGPMIRYRSLVFLGRWSCHGCRRLGPQSWTIQTPCCFFPKTAMSHADKGPVLVFR